MFGNIIIKLINRLCYLYVMIFYKKYGKIPLEFGGGGLINDIGFNIAVNKYGKWIN